MNCSTTGRIALPTESVVLANEHQTNGAPSIGESINRVDKSLERTECGNGQRYTIVGIGSSNAEPGILILSSPDTGRPLLREDLSFRLNHFSRYSILPVTFAKNLGWAMSKGFDPTKVNVRISRDEQIRPVGEMHIRMSLPHFKQHSIFVLVVADNDCCSCQFLLSAKDAQTLFW